MFLRIYAYKKGDILMKKHTHKDFLLIAMVGVAFICTGQLITQALVETKIDETVTAQNQPEALPISQKVETAPAVEEKSTSSFEKLMEFNALATAQKSEWINYMADQGSKKAALINKQHKEWSDFHAQQMNKLNGLVDWSVAAKETFFKEKLEAAIKLYKAECDAWQEFGKNESTYAQTLSEKQRAEFAAKFEPKKVETTQKVTESTAQGQAESQQQASAETAGNEQRVPETFPSPDQKLDVSKIPEAFDFSQGDAMIEKNKAGSETEEFVFDETDDDEELE